MRGGHAAMGGAFVVSSRDRALPVLGDQRFVPAHGNTTCVLACLPEREATSVLEHDILQERTTDGWITQDSLDPAHKH